MNKILFLILAFIIFGLTSTAEAATLTPGPLTITYDGDDQIFSEMNIEPGDQITKDISVTNNGKVAHNLAIATKNVSGELGSRIYISAIESGLTIWTNTIEELSKLSSQSKFITSLNPSETKTITLEASFPKNESNEFKGKTVNFDIVYGTEESEPATRSFNIFSTSDTSASVASTPTETASVTPAPDNTGQVKGDETEKTGLNPWYLLIAPAAVAASLIFLPEFLFVGGLAAIGGGATYVLGYSSNGNMRPTLFYGILIAEVIILLILAYFLLHHDNRASRKVRGYKHRLRIR